MFKNKLTQKQEKTIYRIAATIYVIMILMLGIYNLVHFGKVFGF